MKGFHSFVCEDFSENGRRLKRKAFQLNRKTFQLNRKVVGKSLISAQQPTGSLTEAAARPRSGTSVLKCEDQELQLQCLCI